jgi:S-DNA-T family DNA segregation ATPase FtsK/SpoIIIE
MTTSTETQKQGLDGVLQKHETHHKEYVKEYLYVLLLGITFCIFVSIMTFDPADPSFFNFTSKKMYSTEQISNTFGPIGASVADWSFQTCGIGALVFSGVFMAQLLNTFRRPQKRSRVALRMFGYPQLILSYLGLLSLITPISIFRGIEIYTGGIIGHYVALLCTSFVGKNGALIALSIAGTASLTLALGIRPLTTISFFFSFFPSRTAKDFLGAVINEDPPENLPEKTQSAQNGDQQKRFSSFKTDFKYETANSPYESEKHFSQNFTKNLTYSIHKKDLNFLTSFLEDHKNEEIEISFEHFLQKLKIEAHLIEEKLASFGIKGQMIKYQRGPTLHLYEFEPASGIKINKIFSLQDDLSTALKTENIVIYLHPGKNILGIEVPSPFKDIVSLKEVLEKSTLQNSNMSLPIALGKNNDGSVLVFDLATMPHLLIAGSAGSGRKMSLHIMILSLMLTKTPNQLRLLLVDPKMIELSVYDGIGHLLAPVITATHKALGTLKWAIEEMERRYWLMKNFQVRNILAYNNNILQNFTKQNDPTYPKPETLPHIVLVINELSDLMLTATKEVETSIQKLSQKARAAGIHLILATQQPTVDVLTGVVKANLPCRLSFRVASRHDSRTIIENIGAERLLGQGDMLFLPPGMNKVLRAQCAYVTSQEIINVSNALKKLYAPARQHDVEQEVLQNSFDLNPEQENLHEALFDNGNDACDESELYERAVEFSQKVENLSTSSLQREFRIGYNRAARLMDRMIRESVVRQSDATGKPRPVLKKF